MPAESYMYIFRHPKCFYSCVYVCIYMRIYCVKSVGIYTFSKPMKTQG